MMMRHILFLVLFFLSTPSFASGDRGPNPEAEEVAVSPDGTKIAYVLLDAKKTYLIDSLWIANRDGSNAKAKFSGNKENEIFFSHPEWSPDGKHLAYTQDSDIYIVGVEDEKPLRLTQDAGRNSHARFSPDGRYILFLSDRTGKRELWMMNADGSNQNALGLQHLIVNDPSFSPDGKSIVYAGCERPPNGGALADGKCNLYLISIGMLGDKIVMDTPRLLTEGVEPDWGEKGIVFIKLGGDGIWLINPDGSNERKISKEDSRGLPLGPKWDKSTGDIWFSKTQDATNIWIMDTKGEERKITHYKEDHWLHNMLFPW